MECVLCGSYITYLDNVPFDTTILSHVPPKTEFEYYRCNSCGLVQCPEIISWSPMDLGKYIYCDRYFEIDHGHQDRAVQMTRLLQDLFSGHKSLTHLDYGSGPGLLGKQLSALGWHSEGFDPYYGENAALKFKTYDVITAIEVLEHATDPAKTMADIAAFAHKDTIFLISTSLSDQPLARGKPSDWYYISPRAGHVAIHCEKSLRLLASKFGLNVLCLSDEQHVFYRAGSAQKLSIQQPSWFETNYARLKSQWSKPKKRHKYYQKFRRLNDIAQHLKS